MKRFVVDASFCLSFLLPDEATKEAIDLLQAFSDGRIALVAPTILSYEVVNGLLFAERRKRISHPETIQLLNDFCTLGIPVTTIDTKKAFQLAQQHRLTFYDACYLCLALQKRLPLLSLDKRLQNVM